MADKTIVKTPETSWLHAGKAAQVYETTVEVIQSLKSGEEVTVDEDVADRLIAGGVAKEA